MAEPFLATKALDVSATALGKSTSMVIKGLLVLAFIGFAVWGGWSAFVKPTTTENQSAEQIINNNYILQPKQTFFGCCNYNIRAEKLKKELQGNTTKK